MTGKTVLNAPRRADLVRKLEEKVSQGRKYKMKSMVEHATMCYKDRSRAPEILIVQVIIVN